MFKIGLLAIIATVLFTAPSNAYIDDDLMKACLETGMGEFECMMKSTVIELGKPLDDDGGLVAIPEYADEPSSTTEAPDNSYRPTPARPSGGRTCYEAGCTRPAK
jgi:hypothetical protein